MTPAPTKPSEALRAARELLTPEGAWTKGTLARTADHYPIFPNSIDAVCWCSFGAMERVLRTSDTHSIHKYLDRALEISGVEDGSIAQWNDNSERTHAEILFGFDRAIALAEEAGQ